MVQEGQLVKERYKIVRQIGQGGFSTVYLATDLSLERPVALKLLTTENSENPEAFLQAFLQEARLIARLLHPNILDVYDYGQIGPDGFLVMPYGEQGTLSSYLRQHGKLPLPMARRFFRHLGAALAFAHSQNIVHHDLKPQNILLFEDDRLVITDFGLARLLDDQASLVQSHIGGTPYYMPVEQWEGRAGKPADVYALGVILYQMLAGNVPFRASNPSQIFLLHSQQPLPNLLEIRPDLPPALQTYLERLTAKDPAQRPTAAELNSLLNEMVGSDLDDDWQPQIAPAESLPSGEALTLSSVLAPASPVLEQPRRPGKQGRRSWIIGSLVGLAALVIAVLLGLLVLTTAASPGNPMPSVLATAPDITYNPSPVAPAPILGSPLISFKAQPFQSAELDDTVGQFVITDDLLGKHQKNFYYSLINGVQNSTLSSLPASGQFSPDGKYMADFLPGTTPINPNTPVTNGAADPLQNLQVGVTTLYRVSDGKAVLTVDEGLGFDRSFDQNFRFTPDGHWLLVALVTNQIALIDLQHEKRLADNLVLPEPGIYKLFGNSYIYNFTFDQQYEESSPDGRYIVVWDASDQKDPHHQPHSYLYDLQPLVQGGSAKDMKPVLDGFTFRFSPDSKHMLFQPQIPGIDPSVRIYSLGGTVPQLSVPNLPGIFNNDGSALPGKDAQYYETPTFYDNNTLITLTRDPASGSPATVIAFYDVQTGQLTHTYPEVSRLTFSHNHQWAYSIPQIKTPATPSNLPVYDSKVVVYDAQTGKQLGTVERIKSVLGFSSDDKLLVVFTLDGEFSFYDPQTVKPVGKIQRRFPIDPSGNTETLTYSLSQKQPIMLTLDSENLMTLWRLSS